MTQNDTIFKNSFWRVSALVVMVLLLAGCAMPELPTFGNAPTDSDTAPAQVAADDGATETTEPTEDAVAEADDVESEPTTSDITTTTSLSSTVAVTATTAAVDTSDEQTTTTSSRILVPTPEADENAAADDTAETGTDTASTDDATTSAAPVIPPADEVSERLQVPTGFAVRGYAAGMDKPRLMTIGPDSMLYVADQDAGTVLRLPDANNDGLADDVVTVAEGLAGAHSLEWHEGWLYVASYGEVNRLQDSDGDGTFDTQELVTDNIPGTGGHSSRTLHFGPDGMLYVAAGSTGNNTPEDDPRRATIMRFNPDGTIPGDNPFADSDDVRRQAVWAEGLRNSVDFVFLPDGRLWANHNGSDMLGNDVPPEEIVIDVQRGGHYGWPYCYTPTVGVIGADVVEVRDERVELDPNVLASCADAIPARFTDLAHYAPLGMTQYDAEQFPADYQGNLFVAYHGSWNSTEPRDCRIQMVEIVDGEPVASQPFLTGFRDSDDQQCSQAWGRPAGVVVGPDGALYVSDDQNGQVYRVVYVGE